MNLDKYSRKDILLFGLFVGFIFGCLAYAAMYEHSRQQYMNMLDDSVEIYENESPRKTLHFLYLAEKLREKKYDDTLEHIEGLVEASVEGFTDKGRKLKQLSELEVKALKSVKKYRETYCKKECFDEIVYILDEHYL